ncbi:MAG: cysteine--tRNA ligase, partial [Candidatus Omnitrophica bacterium]|nr:cysteine--tRNA ligase [Candidatus Omnitrophota bacterium]
MAVYVYNSLTRKKEEFIPQEKNIVRMYTCGITAYDDCHLGHARSLYIFEVIRRYLKYRGFKVIFVRNITDIDDKIVNRAKEVNLGWQELVDKYIQSYYEDLSLLGIQKADYEPRATENIPEMIETIKILIEKGFAYPTQTGVYFRIKSFRDYGKLSGQNLEEMLVGVRIEPDEKKEYPLDFALWKICSEDEPGWTSPWGRGRPGWHIECSVMSLKYLKTETLDIHAGGRDLVFPHHENEIAQSQSLTGKPFSRYWLHHGLLTINQEKMAKSLGNFISIKDFFTQYRNLDILKIFFLGTHYSHPIDYTLEKIQEARRALERIVIFWERLNQADSETKVSLIEPIERIKTRFISAMDDDFN